MENENRVKRLSTTKTPKLLDEAEKRSSFKQSQNGATRKLLGIEDKGRYTDVHEDGDLRFGTAEAPELFHINQQIDSLEKKQDRIRGRLKYESVSGKSLLGKEVEQLRKKRLIFSGEKTVYDSGGRKRRIFFKEISRKQADEKDYRNLLNSRDRKRFRNRVIRGKVHQMGKKFINDESIKEDESATEWKGRGRKYYRGTRRTIERSIRNIKLQNNGYTRLKYMGNQQQLLQMKKERILNKARRETYKSRISSASSQYQKRRLKKEMASAIRKNEGNWIKRIKNQIFVRKRSLEQRVRMTKRIATTVMSSLTLLLILMALLGIGTIILVALTEGAAQYVEMAVTMNDYGTLSESTAYLKKQETDLEEYLQNKPELEAELEASYGPDLYEFHYDLADMGFSSTTLMAYLSAKYGAFNLDRVEAEIDSIFQEMYTLEIQIMEELREVIYTNPDTGEQMVVEEPRKICYVTLSKKELEEVIADRMDGEEKIRYSDYKLSSGGQQVYSPIMLEDWTNLISSDYGERIHPITGVRTFHNGVDIAIPTGTKLYSAVAGTVTVAQYSESAGNYVRVQTDSGWVVTFMHMDTLAVSPGQTVEKGDFLGHSGNTGRSTGPHLHLEVRDANNNPINPIFIVPQNCYQQEENDT